MIERQLDDVCVLNGDHFVIEQHVDGGCDFLASQVVDRIENPKRFSQHEVGNPRALGDGQFRCPRLDGVISHDQANQDIGVNRESNANLSIVLTRWSKNRPADRGLNTASERDALG